MSTATINLRNRIAASKKAPGYNERMFVDAPTHELEAMLAERDDLLEALKWCVEAAQGTMPDHVGAIKAARLAIAKATTEPDHARR